MIFIPSFMKNRQLFKKLWSCRWGVTMYLNCGRQRTYCSSPSWYVTTEKHGGMISTGETPDSSTRALWQSYKQCHLIAKQEKLGKKTTNFALLSISFILRRVFSHAVKSYYVYTMLGPTLQRYTFSWEYKGASSPRSWRASKPTNKQNLTIWSRRLNSPLKEGVLWIFTALKIPLLLAGFKPTHFESNGKHGNN
jgi:hypothetical protein